MKPRSSSWLAFTFLASAPSFLFGQALPWGNAPVSGEGTFLMMSDLHFDPFADPKLVPQLIQHPVEDWEGILNSSSSTAFAPYGKDANWPLLLSALQKAQSLGPYDYAVFTGDYLVHKSRDLFQPFGGNDEKAYEDFVTKTEVFVAKEVQKALPGLPIYFCLGNNDSECGDYMIATHSDFLKQFSKQWSILTNNPDLAAQFCEMGNYVVPNPVVPKMEFIILNDVYWSNHFEPDSCHPTNADLGQEAMDWLKDQLQKAKARHLKVQLVLHIPPTADVFGTYTKIDLGVFKGKTAQLFWEPNYQKEFVGLVKDYRKVLVSGFAGHTHMDDYRVLDAGDGKAPFFIHICPAVSPIRGNNPGFQVALYDQSTGEIKDEATYELNNLAAAPSAAQAQWGLEYDFDKAYGLDGYNGASLLALTDLIQTSDATRRDFSLYYRGSVQTPPPGGKFIPDNAWKILNCLHTEWMKKGMEKALKAALAAQNLGN